MSFRNYCRLVLLAILIIHPLANATTTPTQPLSSAWSVQGLLQWNPATDYNAPFNAVHVPLKKRTLKKDAAQLNMMGLFPQQTSRQLSQASPGFNVFDFIYWPYIDIYVYFAGSASEGLIVPPTPAWVVAGHQNGVKVLGTIFFPPQTYGGNIAWVNQLIAEDPNHPGVFPAADQLVKVATLYGFDGWFINQETEGGTTETGQKMIAFLNYLQKIQPEGFEVIWYDAMLPDGNIAYQNELNSANAPFVGTSTQITSQGIFTNYNWAANGLQDSLKEATLLGRSRYIVYSGINAYSSGFNAKSQLDLIAPLQQPSLSSAGLFAANWTYDKQKTYAQNQQLTRAYWAGDTPASPPTWPGIAHYVPTHVLLQDVPFVTYFNIGQGTYYFVDGKNISQPTRPSGWNDMAQQTVLPLLTTQQTALTASYDNNMAYQGGTSLQIAGALTTTPVSVDFYATAITLPANQVLTATFLLTNTAMPSNASLALFFTDPSLPEVDLPLGNSVTTGWNIKTFPLNAYQGKTISKIALKISSPTAVPTYNLHLGQLSLTSTTPSFAPAPQNLRIIARDTSPDGSTDINIQWDNPPGTAWYYRIFGIDATGATTMFLGQTVNSIYNLHFPSGVTLPPQVMVQAVSMDGSKGPHSASVIALK
jgi:endo-beta-N-acetylglucosaminidase D